MSTPPSTTSGTSTTSTTSATSSSPPLSTPPVPPLFHCYEQYSAIYGRSTLPCTTCPPSHSHAKLTRVRDDIYAIGQCEACRFALLAPSSRLCSLHLVHVRLYGHTATRVDPLTGEDVLPDGRPPRPAPEPETIPYSPGMPGNDSVAGFPSSAERVVRRSSIASTFRRLFKSGAAGTAEGHQSQLASHSPASQRPVPVPHSQVHPQPQSRAPLVRRHSRAHPSAKKAAIGSPAPVTAHSERVERKSRSLRWNRG